MRVRSLIFLLVPIFFGISHVEGGNEGAVVQLSSQNVDEVLKSAQVVFVAFCADWCPFSRRLQPIFEEAATAFKKNHPQASVIWAVADSVKNGDIVAKYFVNKYPTMKVFINGEMMAKEYRSTRSVEALTAFVEQQLAATITDFMTPSDLETRIDKTKRNVVGFYPQRDSVAYKNFEKVAAILREDCHFWSAHSSILTGVAQPQLLYKPSDGQPDQHYLGSFDDFEGVKHWASALCVPLVREVTFENVEGLTEEGRPFLIYFRDPATKDRDQIFIDAVTRELYDQKAAINPLLADGHKFAHPLQHLGKSAKDLPLLAIDSFRHMYLFPDMSQMHVPGKLRQFVEDLNSGKLHREFHNGPDPTQAAVAQNQDPNQQQQQPQQGGPQQPPTSPPKSVFNKLKPSGDRYTLLDKDEL